MAIGAIAAVCVTLASGVEVTARGADFLATLVAMLLLVSAVLTRHRLRPRIADALGTVGICWLGGVTGAAVAMSGLHFRLPVADAFLHEADAAIGIDGVVVVETLVRQGQWLFNLMAPAYCWTLIIVALSMVALSATDKRLEAWRAAFCFNGTVLTAGLVAILMPAKGLGVWFSDELIDHLPDGAARYAFGRFDQFYHGSHPQLGIDALEGVVTFPSFHLIMGLVVLAMWRRNLWAFTTAAAWFAVMLLSTFAYGGHYAVDLIGGAAVWTAWFALSRKLEASTALSHASVELAFRPEQPA